MAEIELENLTKVYSDGTQAVTDFDLSVPDGEFVVFVGPSGCGKTTALRMIAGLEPITSGTVKIGGEVVNRLPPKDRDIAMIFQNYALYPHMSARDNMAFGLKLRKVPKAERKKRVDSAGQVLGIYESLTKKPRTLSGGQRQRVAMGRAIVREPQAFLMDEPLSNLDAKLRVSMRAELARLHERLGVTTVYVTHDQVEAMTLGQRVAVLRGGILQQVDTPQHLFHKPVNLFVAAFIGSPSMNLVDARIDGGAVDFAGYTIRLPEDSPLAGRTRQVILGVRPTDFEHAASADPQLPRIAVRPDVVEDLGAEMHVVFTIDAPKVDTEAVRAASDLAKGDEGRLFADDRAVCTAVLDARRGISTGGELELAIHHRRLHFFDPGTGETLGADAREVALV